jgi:transposase-like protein
MPAKIAEAWEYFTPDPEIAEAMEAPRGMARLREYLGGIGNGGFTFRSTPGRSGAGSRRECDATFTALWLAGMSYLKLIQIFGVNEYTLAKWRKRLGLPRRLPPTWTAERLALVRQCHEAGMSAEEGARVLGVKPDTYRVARIRAGIRLKSERKASLCDVPTHLRPDVRG